LKAEIQMKTNLNSWTVRAAMIAGLLVIAPAAAKAANPCLTTQPAFTYTPVAAAGGVGQVTILAAPGCGWSVASRTAFIRIVGGMRGVGTGVVTYQVLPNTTGRVRRGTFGSSGAPDVIPGRSGVAPAAQFTITVDQNR
jgi:hypothetical protein